MCGDCYLVRVSVMECSSSLCTHCRDLLHSELGFANVAVKKVGSDEPKLYRCKRCGSFWQNSARDGWKYVGAEVPGLVTHEERQIA